MKRIFFNSKTDYKKSIPHVSDSDFVPIAVMYLKFNKILETIKKLKRMGQKKQCFG